MISKTHAVRPLLELSCSMKYFRKTTLLLVLPDMFLLIKYDRYKTLFRFCTASELFYDSRRMYICHIYLDNMGPGKIIKYLLKFLIVILANFVQLIMKSIASN